MRGQGKSGAGPARPPTPAGAAPATGRKGAATDSMDREQTLAFARKHCARQWAEYLSIFAPLGRCEVCKQPLGIRGGMGGTGMCGVCCTGEASAMAERGETW